MKKKAKTKTRGFEEDSLESRIENLEDDVEVIAQTVRDLIDMLKSMPDPPCPPMCSQGIFGEKKRKKKKRS